MAKSSGRKKDEPSGGNYEEMRAQRMKENLERMKQLGIPTLASQLKQVVEKVPHKKRAAPASASPADNGPRRRSSRLETKDPVSYKEPGMFKMEKVQEKKKNKYFEEDDDEEDDDEEDDNEEDDDEEVDVEEVDVEEDDVEEEDEDDLVVSIPAGSKPEVYTKKHEKVLGDSKTTWNLRVDGFDEEGERLYDMYQGKTCHQCRQKTLGHHTSCSQCKTISGQLCGDCLCTRYGENVTEANNNADWICPVCRGICNCNRCRRKNGWAPTGSIDKKVKRLGYKSVAHYLIQTFGSRAGLGMRRNRKR